MAGYSCLLDGRPDTVPPEKGSGEAARTVFHDVKSGTHWFHVRAVGAGGRWGETAHQRIVIEE